MDVCFYIWKSFSEESFIYIYVVSFACESRISLLTINMSKENLKYLNNKIIRKQRGAWNYNYFLEKQELDNLIKHVYI